MNRRLLMSKIKEKKELTGLADSVVLLSLDNYLKKYKLNVTELSSPQIKIVMKEVRTELRKLTGRFQKNIKKRKLSNATDYQSFLLTHTSTAERIDFYPELKRIIRKINPKSILDLGCGLNPIALAEDKIKYYASDIKEDELKIIESYFKKNKIPGKTFVHDLRSKNTKLPKADLCVIFKVLDILDKKNHSLARSILEKVGCKKFLISFSTRKISGRPMNHPQRIWFEKTLRNLKYPFEKFHSKNEIFYLASKKPSTAGNQKRSYHQDE